MEKVFNLAGSQRTEAMPFWPKLKEASKQGFDYLKAYNEIENLMRAKQYPFIAPTHANTPIHYRNTQRAARKLAENNVIDVNPARISMLFHRKKKSLLKTTDSYAPK